MQGWIGLVSQTLRIADCSVPSQSRPELRFEQCMRGTNWLSESSWRAEYSSCAVCVWQSLRVHIVLTANRYNGANHSSKRGGNSTSRKCVLQMASAGFVYVQNVQA